MTRVNIKQTIEVYEVDGKEVTPVMPSEKLGVESHWNDRDRVVLVLPSGRHLTVIGDDLTIAITNAMNSGG